MTEAAQHWIITGQPGSGKTRVLQQLLQLLSQQLPAGSMQGLISPPVAMVILATWETLIGLGLIFGVFMRATLLLLFLQMPGTILPVFFFPEAVFTHFPYALTLEGQYIVKNLVLISAGLVLGATVRGGFLVSEPNLAWEDVDEDVTIEIAREEAAAEAGRAGN